MNVIQHPYEGSDLYCERCQLPPENRHHTSDRTDHSTDITALRDRAATYEEGSFVRLTVETAADLLELHDETGISLDNWVAARGLVENLIRHEITENGA